MQLSFEGWKTKQVSTFTNITESIDQWLKSVFIFEGNIMKVRFLPHVGLPSSVPSAQSRMKLHVLFLSMHWPLVQ